MRPLLCATRDEIVLYLNAQDIMWCIDKTNEDCTYRRNYIRHLLLPILQKDCGEDIVEQLARLSKSARGFYQRVCTATDVVWTKTAAIEKESISLNLNILQKLHPEIRIEIIRRALSHLNIGEQDFTENHYQNILRMPADTKFQLPGNVEAHRQGGTIAFAYHSQKWECRAGLAPPKKLNICGTTEFGGVLIKAETFDYDPMRFEKFKANKSNTVEWFDFDRLKLPLQVGFRKPGDRFWPLGLKAEKKIGKFLTAEKIPQKIREKLLIIADSEKIIWLCPVRISEQTKVTSQTRTVLQLKVSTD
jgi:tRNA(Ile)-lysidine synthase